MAHATGTAKIIETATSFTLVVKGSGPPEVEFVNPPDWVKNAVRGNAGAALDVDYSPPAVVNSVTVG